MSIVEAICQLSNLRTELVVTCPVDALAIRHQRQVG